MSVCSCEIKVDGKPRCVCKFASYSQVVAELEPLLLEAGLVPEEAAESIFLALSARETDEVRKLNLGGA